jgi:hypothetical protein
VRLIERPGNPLVPIFSIPGDIAAALPGGQIVANVLDSLLTRGVFSGLTRALFVAPITATLQVAEILDAVRASVVVGDFGTALSELINMPIKVANAFVNGYVPNFPTRSLFQGLLSPNGPLDYFLNDLPNAIFTALNASVAPPVAPTITTAALTTTSPTDIPAASASLISIEAPAADAGETAPVAADTTETETADSGATAPVAETPAAEPVAVETPAVETPTAETPAVETPAVTPVSEETDTEAESGSNKPTSTWGGDKSDTDSSDSGTGTSGNTVGSTAGGNASGGTAASGSDATGSDASGSDSGSASSDSDKSGGSDSDSSGGDE